ncbi:MAG: winged helix-turn-helix transcriptional regulator [Candidatus Kerfeldbacteria bacterium]|nr:winged helix-turn-helix transcriptional regulator [Candidatus Kerfeldbacteria bacterium]
MSPLRFTPQQRTLVRLHKLTFLIDRIAEQALTEHSNITFGQFRLLMALQHHRALSQKKVANFHGLTEAAISRVVETLVKRKYIVRQANPTNRREHILMLTPVGERQAVRAMATLTKTFRKLFGVLTATENEHFNHTLERLLAVVWHESHHVMTVSGSRRPTRQTR